MVSNRGAQKSVDAPLRRRLLGVGAVIAVAAAVAAAVAIVPPTSAEATNWWFWRTISVKSGNDTWYPVKTGAQYNVADVTSYSDSTSAIVFTAGVGTSSGPSHVTQTFGGYRTVDGECKFYTPLVPAGSTGYLTCKLGF
jgi:hypothetical protein